MVMIGCIYAVSVWIISSPAALQAIQAGDRRRLALWCATPLLLPVAAIGILTSVVVALGVLLITAIIGIAAEVIRKIAQRVGRIIRAIQVAIAEAYSRWEKLAVGLTDTPRLMLQWVRELAAELDPAVFQFQQPPSNSRGLVGKTASFQHDGKRRTGNILSCQSGEVRIKLSGNNGNVTKKVADIKIKRDWI